MSSFASPANWNQPFHHLWTWAVGLPGYDKEQWKELEAIVLRLQTERDALVNALETWRTWVPFVWEQGGPPQGTDDELRQRICQQFDDLKAERDALEAAAIAAHQKYREAEQRAHAAEQARKELQGILTMTQTMTFTNDAEILRQPPPANNYQLALALLQSAIREKAEKWRSFAETARQMTGPVYKRGARSTYLNCADELTALLPPPPTKEPV